MAKTTKIFPPWICVALTFQVFRRFLYVRKFNSVIGMLILFITVPLILLFQIDSRMKASYFEPEKFRDISYRLNENGLIRLEDAGGNKKIYFVETSGEECLRPRQACAIESAAIANPDMAIDVRMASHPPPGIPEVDEGEGLERHCKTMDLIKAFPNVNVIREDLMKHLVDTPLEPLASQFELSEYSYQHVSDAVRVALLYKLGGIYLDLDVVVLRSLRNFRNAAGHVYIAGQSSVENGLLIFDKGNQFLRFLMRYMKQSFKPEDRSSIGPSALTQAFRLYCSHASKNITDAIYEYACQKGIKINLFNSTAFNPIGYLEQERFFNERFTYSDFRLLENSYSVHVYGSGHGAHVPETSLFAYFANKYCPSVYRQHKKRVFVF